LGVLLSETARRNAHPKCGQARGARLR
jgi:hypothetical protein